MKIKSILCFLMMSFSVGMIRQMVDYSLVTVYKDSRSLSFSNNRLVIHISLTYFRYFYLRNCQFYLEFRVCLHLPPYLQEVGTFGGFYMSELCYSYRIDLYFIPESVS